MDADASLRRALALLASVAVETGADAYLVGGAVRNALLGRPVHEADLTVGAGAESFIARAAEVLNTRAVVLGSRFEMWRLPLGNTYIDIAPMQGTLAQDLARRDFTVNAMAYPLTALATVQAGWQTALRRDTVIDDHNGLSDLDQRLLRVTGRHALSEDPVRALRCVRLAVELAFEVEPQTLAALRQVATQLGASAAERVGVELMRLFGSVHATRGLRLMDECGLLTACFPALELGRDLEQRPVHRHTVLEHALVSAGWMDTLLSIEPPDDALGRAIWEPFWSGADWTHSQWGPVREHLERHAAVLRAATLLHDIGKPETLTVEQDGRTRFFGHAEVGSDIAAADLERWRLPRWFVERVRALVLEHLRPGQVASAGAAPTPRALHRFQRDLGDMTPDVCLLFLADSLGTVGGDVLLPRWPAYVAHVHRLIAWTRPEAAEQVHSIIDGHAVMAATGLPPGPRIGQMLEAIDEASAAGEVTTVDEALQLARELAGQ